MKKSVILTWILLVFCGLSISFAQEDDIFEHFTEEYGSPNIKNYTLLVLKYRPVVENEPGFAQDTINPKTLAKFVKKENELIEKHNQDLKAALADYPYPYLLIDEKELANYPSSEYPFAYKRYPHVKKVDFIDYSRFFINRKDKKIYKEINLYSSSTHARFGVEKDIIYALSDFLEENSNTNNKIK